jgi:hypothetical protein
MNLEAAPRLSGPTAQLRQDRSISGPRHEARWRAKRTAMASNDVSQRGGVEPHPAMPAGTYACSDSRREVDCTHRYSPNRPTRLHPVPHNSRILRDHLDAMQRCGLAGNRAAAAAVKKTAVTLSGG